MRYLASIMTAAALACAPPLLAQTWQSLALSRSTGNQGYSFGHASKAEADAAALDACRSTRIGSPLDDCALLQSSRQCLALVRSGGTVEAETLQSGEVLTAATQRVCASRNGGDCVIVRSICDDQRRSASAIDEAPAN